ncbi:LysM peptidoglycan-binding domain-containing protein [Longispora albida]|uniref:LysM peptidoglycan-binding domain-containing protein n=1 Tax=Longispora albida TaxID=203523 RepID=UPI000378BE38|nr:LysM peptidoglycan-binding domain-containing protein [Longispora albida]
MARDPYRRSPLAAVATGLRRLAAFAAVVGMTIGVPAGLVTFFGNPLPDVPATASGWQDLLTAGFTDQTVIGLAVICLWLVWAAWCYSLLVETIALLSGRTRSRASFSPMRGLAAALIAGVLATPAAAMAATTPAPAAAAVAVVAAPEQAQAAGPASFVLPGTSVEQAEEAGPQMQQAVRADLPRFAVAATAGTVTVDIAGQQHTIAVQAGDTLWGIAEKCLGDGHRYGEIYELNKDRYDASGRMLGGEHIEAGWVLTLPADAVAPGSTATPAPAPAPQAETPPPPVADIPAPPPVVTPPAVTPGYPQGVDGVVPLPSASPSAAPAAAATHDAESPASAEHKQDDGRPGVTLTGSSWMDLGLAGAVLAAAAAVWAHRRRRYTPLPPTPTARDTDPDLRPLPKTVGQVRRAMLAGPKPLALTTSTMTADTERPAGEAQPMAEVAVERPVTPALDSEQTSAWSPAGLGLAGPGAHAAARGLLAATLANGDVADPHRHSRVVIPATTLATLLGTSAVDIAGTSRLTVASDLDTALEILETTALHRSRLVYDHEADDVAGVRAADPVEEPMPPVVLIADASAPHAAARLAALLTQGRRLDLHGILLGDWPAGHTVTVADDGTTTRPDGLPADGKHPADLGRLAVLDETETADLLRMLAEATTGQPQQHPEAEPDPAAELGHDEEKAGLDVPQAPADDDTAETPVEHEPAAEVRREPRVGQPARVQVLGGFDITPGIDPVPDGDSLRAKAKELLIYLAANNGRASKQTLIEDLLPDAKITSAHHRLNTISSNLRTYLRRLCGPGMYLERTAHHYQLRRDELDIDLLHMRDALAAYAKAADDAAREQALREALSAYGGPLADGLDIDWIDLDRTKITRQALDAHIALAELLATTSPAEAAGLLDAAIALDPTAEDTYRRAMRQRAALGEADAVRALRRAVTAALSDIDADPEEETLKLAERLLAGLASRTPATP